METWNLFVLKSLVRNSPTRTETLQSNLMNSVGKVVKEPSLKYLPIPCLYTDRSSCPTFYQSLATHGSLI
ncbi:hypothetical protein L218DRAFT_956166, partial [Marasmius fiardii PR-910]